MQKEWFQNQERQAQALFSSLGIEVSSSLMDQITGYLNRLLSENKKTNLISCRSDEELFWHHLMDALMPLRDPSLRGRAFARCVDIGSGGGFPGIPLQLAKPSWALTLIDSVRKKQLFLKSILEEYALHHCSALWARAEELGKEPLHRENYDVAFCRALGAFSTCLELAMPFLKISGSLYALRGAEAPQEAKKAQSALEALGGEIKDIFDYHLPRMNKTRYIVRVDKTKSTPAAYPRRTGVPAKKPL